MQETIQNSSSIILSFLSDVALDETAREESATAYSHLRRCQLFYRMAMNSHRYLVDISFISILFTYRRVFHGIAAREADALAVVVCWVDVVLSRLGEAIVQISGGNISVSEPNFPTSDLLQKQRDDDALRAAIQLPRMMIYHCIVTHTLILLSNYRNMVCGSGFGNIKSCITGCSTPRFAFNLRGICHGSSTRMRQSMGRC